MMVKLEGTLDRVNELIEVLNQAQMPNNMSIEVIAENDRTTYNLATGDQYVIQTHSLNEVEALLWGMTIREYRGSDLRWIREEIVQQQLARVNQ